MMKKVIYAILGSLSVLVLALAMFVSCDNDAKSGEKEACTKELKDGKKCCKEGDKKECKAGDKKEGKKHEEGAMKKCCAGKDSIACAEHKAAMKMEGKECKKDCAKPCCADKKMKKTVEEETIIEEVIEE
jgi:hypothetical protein